MKIHVDMEACVGHGQCVIACPEVFELDGKGGVNYVAEPDDSLLDSVEAAIDACPEQAITSEE
jgi:ferredoxin